MGFNFFEPTFSLVRIALAPFLSFLLPLDADPMLGEGLSDAGGVGGGGYIPRAYSYLSGYGPLSYPFMRKAKKGIKRL